MNKSQFIEMVAGKAEMSKAAAARAVDAIFNTSSGAIAEAVNAAGQLSIPGFGKFTRKTRAARTGRNPRTGAAIDIPERTSIGFTAGRGLRGAGEGGEGGGGGSARKSGGAAAKKSGGGAAAKKSGGATAKKSAESSSSSAGAAKKSGGGAAKKSGGGAAKKGGGAAKKSR